MISEPRSHTDYRGWLLGGSRNCLVVTIGYLIGSARKKSKVDIDMNGYADKPMEETPKIPLEEEKMENL